ncbi:leng8 [Acrasis kona]|uniref:Leng8 n=1 Tax=Acrasis kona TaxID=1008807 RepID=A0AAW2Z8X3_9EUKA
MYPGYNFNGETQQPTTATPSFKKFSIQKQANAVQKAQQDQQAKQVRDQLMQMELQQQQEEYQNNLFSKKRPFSALNSDNIEQETPLSKKKQKQLVRMQAKLAQAQQVQEATATMNGTFQHYYLNRLDSDVVNHTTALIGTSTDLEKPYLRLTSRPEPDTVRPENILKKSMKYVIDRFYREKKEYRYICEQMKSLRQDLTDDLAEFNQCQTQLKYLYAEGITGSVAEFTSYRIIYLVFTNSYTDLTKELKNLLDAPLELRNHKYVKFAMSVQSTMSIFNFHALLTKLYREKERIPPCGRDLIRLFCPKLRRRALLHILKAHARTSVDVNYLRDELGYEDTESDEDEFLRDIIQGYKIVLNDDINQVDCYNSLLSLEKILEEEAAKSDTRWKQQ